MRPARNVVLKEQACRLSRCCFGAIGTFDPNKNDSVLMKAYALTSGTDRVRLHDARVKFSGRRFLLHGGCTPCLRQYPFKESGRGR